MVKLPESRLAAAFEEVCDANALSDHFVLTDNPLASSDEDNDPDENEPKSKTLRKTKFENPIGKLQPFDAETSGHTTRAAKKGHLRTEDLSVLKLPSQ